MKQPSENLLDFDRLRSLAELTDGTVFRIVEHFTESLLERISGISAAVAQRDAAATRALVHQLKGSAANCGFVILASMLAKPREDGDFDAAVLERCARESIDVWKIFMSREITNYPGLNGEAAND